MFDLGIAFDYPRYLLLLLLLPLLWVFSYRSLSGLGRTRRVLALLLRTAVVILVVFALAELQLVRVSPKLAVIYLLDQSDSIPGEQREAMLRYVRAEVKKHRQATRGDKAGVIVFGRGANIEVAPFDDDLPITAQVETRTNLRTDGTNLAEAMKLAQASFPEDCARRIVIVSDGNENLGDARSMARILLADGVGIDVAPVKLTARAEVAVEKIALPSDIRKDQPFTARVVVNNYAQPTAGNSGVVSGKVVLKRLTEGSEQVLAEEAVNLNPGKNIFEFRQELKEADFFTYEATFVPDDPRDDGAKENNRATAFTNVQGDGHVLLVVESESPNEFDELAALLRRKYQVTVKPTDDLFTSFEQLQRYDTVILANVSRTSDSDIDSFLQGGDKRDPARIGFTDERVNLLVRNTQQSGCGLVMLGGDRTFGAGGWANSELEKAMPVDFTIKNHKVVPVGALVLVLHASEIPDANNWQKKIAAAAIKTLGVQDYVGIIFWGGGNGADDWLWKDGNGEGLTRIGDETQRQKMLARLDRMVPGDMPDFEPPMMLGAKSLAALGNKAALKHMIVISDGDPAAPTKSITTLRNASATCSTVACGTHGVAATLKSIASQCSGKFYDVKNPAALPRIFQREARRVAQPLIFEREVVPQVTSPHEMIEGIKGPLPSIRGFVLTTKKENPLVEICIESPQPEDDSNRTILAGWTYGLGRTAVLTTDAGRRWATNWKSWADYDKFFLQLVRWSMRPTNRNDNFTLSSEVKDGKVKLTVTGLTKQGEFLNFLPMTGSTVGPKMAPRDIAFTQTAPGRYEASFDADDSGSYFLTVVPGAGKAPIRAGVNVPYSAEYRDRETNRALLDDLVAHPPEGGEGGVLIDGALSKTSFQELLAVDTFRHNLQKARSSQSIWPMLLVILGGVFLTDVFIRRVAVGWEWLAPVQRWIAEKVFRRTAATAPDERMERLRSRKQQVTQNLEQVRAATRFEPQIDAPPPPDLAAPPPAAAKEKPKDAAGGMAPQPTEDADSYTARLLRAKRQARDDKEKG